MMQQRHRKFCASLRFTWLILPLFLTGCMVGPKYKVPATPAPPAYKETLPTSYSPAATDGWKPGQPYDQIPRGTWWTVFNDSELNTLEPQVEAANQQLRQADANLRAAIAEVRVRKADRFPTLGVDPTITSQRYNANQPYFNAAPGLSATSSW